MSFACMLNKILSAKPCFSFLCLFYFESVILQSEESAAKHISIIVYFDGLQIRSLLHGLLNNISLSK